MNLQLYLLYTHSGRHWDETSDFIKSREKKKKTSLRKKLYALLRYYDLRTINLCLDTYLLPNRFATNNLTLLSNDVFIIWLSYEYEAWSQNIIPMIDYFNCDMARPNSGPKVAKSVALRCNSFEYCGRITEKDVHVHSVVTCSLQSDFDTNLHLFFMPQWTSCTLVATL